MRIGHTHADVYDRETDYWRDIEEAQNAQIEAQKSLPKAITNDNAIYKEGEKGMKLQPAAEIKKVSVSNFDKLKADALQSDDFKNLIKGIENQAEKGLCEYTYYHNTNKQIVAIFQQTLQENGYIANKDFSGLGLTIKW